MGFLSDLGNQLADQFLGGELPEDQRTLSGKLDGQQNNFAKLGDFAKNIDQSAQRNYLEEGYLQNNYGTASAKMMEISMQEPNVTVLIKKKMYSSLAGNFVPEFMNEEEKLVFLAMDNLFLNKCKQISAYEKLCKIQLASQKAGEIDEQVLPFIIGLSDFISSTTISGEPGEFSQTVRKIKSIFNYSAPNFYTQWIEDIVTPYSLRYGRGTGVIELTNFTNVSCSCSLSSGGMCSIGIDDPYEIMTVTPMDIEYAISDTINVNNAFESKKGFSSSISLGKETAEDLVEKKIGQLNQTRRSRGASEISFKINPDTVYGRRVIAIVDVTGQEIIFEPSNLNLSQVKVADPYLLGGAVLGEQGLSPLRSRHKISADSNVLADATNELNLFSDTINAIYTKIKLDKATIRNYDFVNGASEIINNVRRKLTFYFSGKNIIQPMDTVNIFMSSKTKFDGKVMSGIQNAFNGFGLFTNFSNTIYDIKNSYNNFFLPSNNLDLQTEKSIFLGNTDIPNYLWNMLRSQFTSEKEGAHVFAGVVTSVGSSYSGGVFGVDITARDNTYYLEQGRVNFNPGVDTTAAGMLYDPLTPYKTGFDQTYSLNQNLELLDENQALINSGLIRFSAGNNAGRAPSLQSLHSEIQYGKADYTLRGKKIIFAPDGLLYKWKEGIGILSLGGSSDEIFTEEHYGQQSSTTEVLANQDVMNTISLLVTGTPYNYPNYFKAGIDTGGLNLNKDNSRLVASRLSQLSSNIQKNNSLWGNFVPFKNLSIDEKSYTEMISLRTQDLIKAQVTLQENYKSLQELQFSIIVASLNNDSTINPSAIMEQNKEKISKSQNILQDQEQSFTNFLKTDNFTIIGNDISTDYNYYLSKGINYEDPNNRRALRRKINFLTRRLSWAVRSNQDVNYFIVDDSYDKSYDLSAFEADIAGQKIDLYNNRYSTVLEKIKSAAKVLDLEFFADTQGHLRVRTPQYNRMPKSVFYKMLQNKNSKSNIQIFPQFLNNLFFNQIQSLYNKITAIEDELRIFAAISGQKNNRTDDTPVINFIKSSTSNDLGSPLASPNSAGKANFNLLSDPYNGEIKGFAELYSFLDSNGNINSDRTERDDNFEKTKNLNGILKPQLNIKSTFDLGGRLNNFRNTVLNSQLLQQQLLSTQEDESKDKLINYLIDRVYKKIGVRIKPQDYIYSNSYGGSSEESGSVIGEVVFPKFYQVDSFKITNEMAKKIFERQKAIKSLYSVIKNASELNSLNNSETTTQLLFPSSTTSSQTFPEAFEYLIEDESYDDYGPGSGSRYIIKNSQIINYNIDSNGPEYTSVRVTGRLDKNLPKSATQSGGPGFDFLPNGGNALISSDAIDYDLWKMYGLKEASEVDMPFLTNPQSQTGPFAAALLSRQRKNIIKGSVTVIGNEFSQPGEVVYLEQKGMLFYVESVRHTISMGGEFATTLDLSYGHYPGEYIPTNLDIAGKMLYNNRDNVTIDNRKNLNVVDGTAVGCFVLDPQIILQKGTTEEINQKLLSEKTPIGNTNSNILKQISSAFDKAINSNNDPNFDLELRLVIYEDKAFKKSDITKNFANYIKSIFDGTSTFNDEDPSLLNFRNRSRATVTVAPAVDLSSSSRRSSPSRFAFNAADQLAKKDTSSITPAADPNAISKTPVEIVYKKKKYLVGYIIDCFIKPVLRK
jgi:hypothetical protein